jgi:hypothetical protein
MPRWYHEAYFTHQPSPALSRIWQPLSRDFNDGQWGHRVGDDQAEVADKAPPDKGPPDEGLPGRSFGWPCRVRDDFNGGGCISDDFISVTTSVMTASVTTASV